MKLFNKNPLDKIREKYWLIGLLQALGVILYILIFIMLSANGPFMFVNVSPNPLMMGMIVLMSLSFSALICGTLALGYPLYLALQKKV